MAGDSKRIAMRLACALGLGAAGCGLTPKSQLDDCRQRGQALQAENARLKDQVLTLRSENQDLAQRSVDDERRLKVQEDAVDRLERSVQSYQDEREQLAAAYDRLKLQVQGAAGPESDAGAAKPASEALTVLAGDLFVPGGDRLRTDGEASDKLKALAASLAKPENARRSLKLVAPSEDPSVQRASADAGSAPSRQRFLMMARLRRLRAWLASEARIDPERIQFAEDGDTPGRVATGPAGP